MEVIAQRGFADDGPENTVAAVRVASRVADAVEVDVRRCGSGELVVCHDERVDRVTDGTGPVADHDLAALRSLDVDGSGEGIPTLAAVLEAAAPGTRCHVELKEAGLAADALAVVEDVGRPTTLSSFDPAVVEAVRSLEPDRPTALLATRLRDRPVRTARRLGCDGLHLHWARCLAPGVVRSARSAGLVVNAWTVQRPAVVRLLDRLGVDGVAVDAAEVVPDGVRNG